MISDDLLCEYIERNHGKRFSQLFTAHIGATNNHDAEVLDKALQRLRRSGRIHFKRGAWYPGKGYTVKPGLHPYRMQDNPEEKRFAEAWYGKNDNKTPLLAYLMGDGARPVDVSDRDKLVAATVVQWLGSPVGLRFLEDLGYVKQ